MSAKLLREMESEDSWKRLDDGLQLLNKEIQAGKHTPDTLIKVMPVVAQCLISDRSKLSGSACQVVSLLPQVLSSHQAIVIVEPLLKVTLRSSKLMVQRAQQTLYQLVEQYQPSDWIDHMVQYQEQHMANKMLRLTVAHVLVQIGTIEHLDLLRMYLTDADGLVREQGRLLFERLEVPQSFINQLPVHTLKMLKLEQKEDKRVPVAKLLHSRLNIPKNVPVEEHKKVVFSMKSKRPVVDEVENLKPSTHHVPTSQKSDLSTRLEIGRRYRQVQESPLVTRVVDSVVEPTDVTQSTEPEQAPSDEISTQASSHTQGTSSELVTSEDSVVVVSSQSSTNKDSFESVIEEPMADDDETVKFSMMALKDAIDQTAEETDEPDVESVALIKQAEVSDITHRNAIVQSILDDMLNDVYNQSQLKILLAEVRSVSLDKLPNIVDAVLWELEVNPKLHSSEVVQALCTRVDVGYQLLEKQFIQLVDVTDNTSLVDIITSIDNINEPVLVVIHLTLLKQQLNLQEGQVRKISMLLMQWLAEFKQEDLTHIIVSCFHSLTETSPGFGHDAILEQLPSLPETSERVLLLARKLVASMAAE